MVNIFYVCPIVTKNLRIQPHFDMIWSKIATHMSSLSTLITLPPVPCTQAFDDQDSSRGWWKPNRHLYNSWITINSSFWQWPVSQDPCLERSPLALWGSTEHWVTVPKCALNVWSKPKVSVLFFTGKPLKNLKLLVQLNKQFPNWWQKSSFSELWGRSDF